MGKGDETRQAILDHAVGLARQIGLQGLTIGRLADDLKLSKSGLFAHFKSKEALHVETIEAAAAVIIDVVLKPALKAPRGEARLRELFERWLEWESGQQSSGGCFFVQASAELDDLEGPARDRLVQRQRDWLDSIATMATGAIREGQFADDVDAEQFAYDLHGIMLAYHHAQRLLRDRKAETRARVALERLIAAARVRTPAASR